MIQFRGRRFDNGEWAYGSLIDDHYILQYIDLAESWVPNSSDHKIICRAFHIDPVTVGQYTGLKDRNGKKIFEGDIVNAYDHPTGVDSRIGVVELMRGCWGVSDSIVTLSDYGTAWIDVIGNIYDNPHLLNPAGGTASSINMQHDPKEQTEPAQEAAEQATETTTANSEAGEATDTEAGGE